MQGEFIFCIFKSLAFLLHLDENPSGATLSIMKRTRHFESGPKLRDFSWAFWYALVLLRACYLNLSQPKARFLLETAKHFLNRRYLTRPGSSNRCVFTTLQKDYQNWRTKVKHSWRKHIQKNHSSPRPDFFYCGDMKASQERPRHASLN